jgi:general secretion pathway protein K
MNGRRTECGVALIVVLWVTMVLSLLISGFAFTMHVETQIASFARKEQKANALARAGVEVARWQLFEHQKSPKDGGFDALNQAWFTNEEYYVNHALGDGTFTVMVEDEEQRLQLNQLTEEQWLRLFDALGVEATEGEALMDCILDWTDDNDLHRLNGAESDYYLQLPQPYRAKDGPIDRVDELRLVKGMTQALFEGAPGEAPEAEPRPGLRDVLTTTSSGRVNVNTASELVLHVMFDLDEAQLEGVLARRRGPDGVIGTEDDQPYQSVDEFIREVAATDADIAEQCRRDATVKSSAFRVTATGNVAGVKRSITTILRWQDNQFMIGSWEERSLGQ